MPPNQSPNAQPSSPQEWRVRVWKWSNAALRIVVYGGFVIMFVPFLVGFALGNARPVWLVPALVVFTALTYLAVVLTLFTLAVWLRPNWPTPSRAVLRALLAGLYLSSLIFAGGISMVLADFLDVHVPDALFNLGLFGGGLLFIVCSSALGVIALADRRQHSASGLPAGG